MGNIPRKLVSDSFYQHEIEEELRERGLSWSFNGDNSDGLTAVLKKINELQSSEIYPHPDDQCSEACAARGLIITNFLHFCYLIRLINDTNYILEGAV